MENSTKSITTANDILAQLRAGVQEIHEIRMRDAVIPVRVLAGDEFNRCRQEAMKFKMIGKGDDADMNFELQKNILALASSVPVNSAPILSRKVLDQLTIDEINMLYEEYINIMERVNPSLEQLMPEEFRVLVEALKKSLVTSKDLSLKQLRAICGAFQELIQKQVNP